MTHGGAEADEEIRLIDLGGGSSCIYPPLLSYSPGDGVHDPLFSPPEVNLLPDDAKPPTLRNARGLWKEHAPYLFDLFSVGAHAPGCMPPWGVSDAACAPPLCAGVVFMQLALPRLRTDKALKTFRDELSAADGDLMAWRAAKATPADDAVLGQRGGAGWDLAAALLRPERIGSKKGKNVTPGRASCAEALAHPFLAEDWEDDAEE
jgi:hypothetical protein